MNVITGKVAPAGRLPVTQYPANYTSQVPMTDMSLRPNATSGNPGRTYKWFNDSIIPFGFGMHYTNFTVTAGSLNNSYDISSLQCNATHLDLCPFGTLNATVQNTGSVTSDFSLLAFVSGQYGPQPYPLKQLATYTRLFNVTAGSSATAQLNMTLGQLARYDDSGNAILYPGNYEILLDVPTQATVQFQLTGSQVMLDQFPQPPA